MTFTKQIEVFIHSGFFFLYIYVYTTFNVLICIYLSHVHVTHLVSVSCSINIDIELCQISSLTFHGRTDDFIQVVAGRIIVLLYNLTFIILFVLSMSSRKFFFFFFFSSYLTRILALSNVKSDDETRELFSLSFVFFSYSFIIIRKARKERQINK
jgi:hypothetical protein